MDEISAAKVTICGWSLPKCLGRSEVSFFSSFFCFTEDHLLAVPQWGNLHLKMLPGAEIWGTLLSDNGSWSPPSTDYWSIWKGLSSPEGVKDILYNNIKNTFIGQFTVICLSPTLKSLDCGRKSELQESTWAELWKAPGPQGDLNPSRCEMTALNCAAVMLGYINFYLYSFNTFISWRT